MYLKLDSGEAVSSPTTEDVMRMRPEAFAILGASDLHYIQCIRQPGESHGYSLEYQEGSIEEHYRASDDRIPLDAVVSTFAAYLAGGVEWRSRFQWRKTDPALRARASGPTDKHPRAEDEPILGYLGKFFGENIRLQTYEHPTEPLMVDIASASGQPRAHVTSYSTVGLWRSPNAAFLNADAPRLEICGACASTTRLFPNVLASAAFRIMRDRWPCRPGGVLVGAMATYGASRTLPHLYFTVPFLWDDNMKIADQARTILWLLAHPISEAERAYLVRRGDKALEGLFEEKQIDIFDVERPSVL